METLARNGLREGRSSQQMCSVKKVFFRISQIAQENTCARVPTLLKKRLAQVFSCEFCENFKNTFFTEHLWTTASEKQLTQNNSLHFVQDPSSRSINLI